MRHQCLLLRTEDAFIIQMSPAHKVDAVVNNSLNVFGSVEVFMHTLDLNTSVKQFLHTDKNNSKTPTVQWEVAVSSFLLPRPNLTHDCKHQIAHKR